MTVDRAYGNDRTVGTPRVVSEPPKRHSRTHTAAIPEPPTNPVIPEWGYRESTLALPAVAQTPEPNWIPTKPPLALFHSDAFRQVTGLVNVGTFHQSNVVRQQLKRYHVQHGRKQTVVFRHH